MPSRRKGFDLGQTVLAGLAAYGLWAPGSMRQYGVSKRMRIDRTEPGSADASAAAATRRWLERAVIGLNLCPFAKAVHVKNQIRYVVSAAQTPEDLLAELISELHTLQAADAAEIDTTLLVHPQVLVDFLDYNDFLETADAALAGEGLAGEIQIASFHPQYQFAGTQPEVIENYSNRSPYPTLHLLREASIERAVAAFPDASEIFERNIQTLRRLGHAGWRRLWMEEG